MRIEARTTDGHYITLLLETEEERQKRVEKEALVDALPGMARDLMDSSAEDRKCVCSKNETTS